MRNIVKAIWLITIISFSGLLVCSIVYEIDGYQGLINFELHITGIAVVKNNTDAFLSIKVNASIFNPSHFSSFELEKIDAIIFLNGQQGEYLRGPKWFSLTLYPRRNASIKWSYNIESADLDIVNNANSTEIWVWYFYLQVSLMSDMIGVQQFDRSQSFSGAIITPSLDS